MCGLSLTQVSLQVHDHEQAEERIEFMEASSHIHGGQTREQTFLHILLCLDPHWGGQTSLTYCTDVNIVSFGSTPLSDILPTP